MFTIRMVKDMLNGCIMVKHTINEYAGASVSIIVQTSIVNYRGQWSDQNTCTGESIETLHCKNEIVKIKMDWLVQLQGCKL